MELITSRSNTKVKFARSLRQRKNRDATGLFLVEGIHHVGEAVEAGADVRDIFYSPELLHSEFALGLVDQQSSTGVACHSTTADVFTSLAEKENPQGILAVVALRSPPLETLDPQTFPLGIALVSPQDPGNVGTILRTIDAAGASGLILLENPVDPTHPTAVRASMGAVFHHPVLRVSFEQFVEWSAAHAYHIYGTSAHGSLDYRQVAQFRSPLILLMGSEREGLSAEHIAVCEQTIRLPMRGRVSSLNLAVAAGILLYSILGKLN